MKRFIILSVIFSINHIYAQTNWVNLDTSSGLINNSVQVICSDDNSNIWIALGSGTDGQGLMKYSNNTWTLYDSSNCAIPSNSIKNMKFDTNGKMWITFVGGYINSFLNLVMFDGNNWNIYNTNNSNIMSDKIVDIYIDKSNNVWLTCSEGISKYDGNTFTNYPLNIIPCKIFVEDSTKIWFSYSKGLAKFNSLTLEIDTFTMSNSNIPGQYISSMALDTNNLLWLGFCIAFNGRIGYGGTNGGLATFDGVTFSPVWPFYNIHTGVYDLTVDMNKNIWVATRCEGLYKYNGTNWEQIQGIITDGCSFSVTIDKENYIWYSEVYTGVWTNKISANIYSKTIKDVINFFPNPVTDLVYINCEEKATVEIINMQGQVVATKMLSEKNSSVDVFGLRCGVYTLRIKTESGIVIKKIVKE